MPRASSGVVATLEAEMRCALVAGAIAVACAGAEPRPAPKPVELAPPPRVAEPGPPPSAPAPSASAADEPAEANGVDVAALEAETKTPVPPAPAKTELRGELAVVWVLDLKAGHGVQSQLVELVGGKPKLLAKRPEPVLVGSSDLWVIRTKKLASLACSECELCTTEPPTCKSDVRIDLNETYLRSLRTRKTLEPWKNAFRARNGCRDRVGDHQSELSLEGGAGSVYYFTLFESDMFCGGAHPLYQAHPSAVDVDTGKGVTLTLPQEPTAALKKRSHGELAGGCVVDPKEEPQFYRATASYSDSGELRGTFSFTMASPYMCGTGPGHYSTKSDQASDWIPPELARWGKLPDWLAEYVASVGAAHAFVIGKKRATAAKVEFKR